MRVGDGVVDSQNPMDTTPPNEVMSQEPSASKNPTPETPVDPEVLQRLTDMQNRRMQLAERFLDHHLGSVQCLREAASIDASRGTIFQAILAERGLRSDTPIEIDAKTGVVRVMEGGEVAPPEGAPEEPPTAG